MQNLDGISVVIPLYNKENYILDALKSISAQSFRRFEVIVVDDGSTDGGPELVRKFDLPQLQLLAQENSGVSVARNNGVSGARFELVAFLDADDFWLPDHLLNLWKQYVAFPDAVMYSNRFSEVEGTIIEKHSSSESVVDVRIVNHFFKEYALGSHMVFTSATMVRKSFFEQAGGFPVGYNRGEDVAVWSRLSLLGGVVSSGYVGVLYRRGTNGLTSAVVSEPDIAMKTLFEISARMDDPDEASYARELAYKIALAHCFDSILAGSVTATRRHLEFADGTRLFKGRRRMIAILSQLPCLVSCRVLRGILYAKDKAHFILRFIS